MLYTHNISYLHHVAIRLSCCSLAALLHGWRWRGRWRKALSSNSRDLEQWHSWVEVHGDLRRHGVWGCRLQADREGSSRALHGVVVLHDIQLRGNHVHRRHGSITRDCLRRRLTFRGVCGAGKQVIIFLYLLYINTNNYNNTHTAFAHN